MEIFSPPNLQQAIVLSGAAMGCQPSMGSAMGAGPMAASPSMSAPMAASPMGAGQFPGGNVGMSLGQYSFVVLNVFHVCWKLHSLKLT